MGATKDVKGPIIRILFGYGGRDEVVLATQAIANLVKNDELNVNEITPDLFESHLCVQQPLDCLVRTSGEKRLSGFLPWQSCYAELIFAEKYWPQLRYEDFDQFLE